MKSKFIALMLAPCSLSLAQLTEHPNVILIITDDQGYGDFSFTGNRHVRTTNIDRLAQQSVQFDNFFVCPVSAPTRSGLMTGRYSLRTGIRDTYNGGAVMSPDEVTIAEVLKTKGYTTGQFGKWHLGDNYPSRPVDQGFDESLYHFSGGMGQVGDFTTWFRGDSSYFDPILWHNGNQEKHKGYCSDIFADEAVKFIDKNREGPFFCYLAFNAPHTPLQVPVEYYNRFRETDPSDGYDKDGRPFPEMSEQDKEDARKVYAMVSNLDDNIGKVLRKIDETGISENTIVIFLTDNGPQQRRYNAGMRGLKSSVYNGGVRVPCLIRYPGKFRTGTRIGSNTAYIDIMPTVAGLCNAEIPAGVMTDGRNLVPLISGDREGFSDRSLFFYWTRKYPELYNNISLLKDNYKLAAHTDYNAAVSQFELYDISRDPYEQDNIIMKNMAIAGEMKEELDSVFKDLISSPALMRQQVSVIGTKHENPVFLNRNDAGGDRGIWAQEEVYGLWRVKMHEGRYNIRFTFIKPVMKNGQMVIETGSFVNQIKNTKDQTTEIIMTDVGLPGMECDLVPYYQDGSRRIFPFLVELERIK